MRAAFSRSLISAALGRSGQLTWLWGRNQNGVGLSRGCTPTGDDALGEHTPTGFIEDECNKQAGWFALSLLQSPRGLHAHAQSTLIVQRHANTFAALGAARPRIWLLHSHSAARLSLGQSRATIALVEALAFIGSPYGFIDADDAHFPTNFDAIANRDDWLMIPGVTHASPSLVLAVAARVSNATLRARTVGITDSAMAALLSLSPYGEPFASDDAALAAAAVSVASFRRQLTALRSHLPTISLDVLPTVGSLTAALEQRLAPDQPTTSRGDDDLSQPLRVAVCVDADAASSSDAGGASAALGVFSRAIVDDTGQPSPGDTKAVPHVTLFVSNLRNQSTRVRFLISQHALTRSAMPDGSTRSAMPDGSTRSAMPDGTYTRRSGSYTTTPGLAVNLLNGSVVDATVPCVLRIGESMLLRLSAAPSPPPTPPSIPPSPLPPPPPHPLPFAPPRNPVPSSPLPPSSPPATPPVAPPTPAPSSPSPQLPPLPPVSPPATVSTSWEAHLGANCYVGHGGTDIDGAFSAGDLNLTACQQLCEHSNTCVAVTVSHGVDSCWRRSAIELSACERASPFDTHMKMWALPPPASPPKPPVPTPPPAIPVASPPPPSPSPSPSPPIPSPRTPSPPTPSAPVAASPLTPVHSPAALISPRVSPARPSTNLVPPAPPLMPRPAAPQAAQPFSPPLSLPPSRSAALPSASPPASPAPHSPPSPPASPAPILPTPSPTAAPAAAQSAAATSTNGVALRANVGLVLFLLGVLLFGGAVVRIARRALACSSAPQQSDTSTMASTGRRMRLRWVVRGAASRARAPRWTRVTPERSDRGAQRPWGISRRTKTAAACESWTELNEAAEHESVSS